ncbi:hypothetical protein C8J56DRAFT_196165 [Mycena floridula]|nr:hypothetical protein C8J56DRAFT_196165 [Mycena floridula]
MLKSRCRPDTIQRQVKVLCCTEAFKISTLRSIFSACSDLQTIGIFIWAETWARLDAALDDLASTGPRPSKLSCDSWWTRRIDGSDRFSLPLFQNVTHLELRVTKVEDFDANRLYSLASLTHLSLVDTSGEFYVSRIIQQLDLADSIMVCILYSTSYLFLSRDTIMVPDPRVLVVSMSLDHRLGGGNTNVLVRNLDDANHYIRQWGQSLETDKLDMWEEAEEIVKMQRARLAASNDLQ